MTHQKAEIMEKDNTEIDDIKQKVENLGVTFEKFGRSPMVSRVFAFLLLSSPPHQTFDEITEFLSASKSAVSNALSTLQTEGIVTYITFSGDRKRYFRIDTDNWLTQLMDSAKNLSAFNDLLTDVYDFRKQHTSDGFNKELLKLLDFQVFLSSQIESAIGEWQNNRV